MQARDRSCFPPPHILLHLLQNPHTVHLPFIVIRAEIRCHSIAPNRMLKHFHDFAFRRRHPIEVKHLPGHPFSLQLRDCSLMPSQSAPPNAGAGFVHVQ